MDNSCTCENCRNACRTKPGWFMPGEIEKVAEYLGISLQELFDSKLGVDWYEQFGGDIFVIAPAIQDMEPGEEYPANPQGECVFFENERCVIHAVKPFECKAMDCGESHAASEKRHKEITEAWQDNEGQIIELLGYEPEAESYGFLDVLFW